MYKKSVQLYCIHNTITTNNAAGYCAFFIPCCTSIMERQWKYLACQSSNLLLKLRLSVNCQHCCRSNIVIKAKEQGLTRERRMAASTRKHSIEHFPGDVLLV